VKAGTATVTATAGDETANCKITVTDLEPEPEPEPDPSIVDEGVVINGVTWATRNVAAPGHFADKGNDAGQFYQWNRNIGWSATDPLVNSNGGTTWDSTSPTGKTWTAANDPSPEGWQVATEADFDVLLDVDNVTYQWTTQNGVNGGLFTDKATGKTLFLPAAGFRKESDGNITYADGYYWTATVRTTTTARGFTVSAGNKSINFYDMGAGHLVRSVKK
jgi:hypothetical protein